MSSTYFYIDFFAVAYLISPESYIIEMLRLLLRKLLNVL